MCLICDHYAPITQVGDFRRCEHCKTYVAIVLPDNRKVQKVLEEHACSYIFGPQELSGFHTEITRVAIIKSFSKSAHAILDFGCGNGKFVKFLLTKRYKAFGYDKSLTLQKYLNSKNIPFYKSLKQIPDKYFDVITCFDVIEHTTNPYFLVETLKNKLKTAGILIISTPNSTGISARILGTKWWVFGPDAHFILFSTKSIKLLLNNAGFHVLAVDTDTLTPWFTPSDKHMSKIFNKIIYLIMKPFQNLLFKHNFGDNIISVAQIATS